MAYLRGPYVEQSSLPSPTTTVVSSARGLNFATRRYTFDANGNPLAMDDTAQRVMLCISYAAPKPPLFLTDRDLEQRRQQIRTALGELEAEGAITVTRITVERTAAGSGHERIDFLNRHTGANETITRP